MIGKLTVLPESIGGLSLLEELDLSDCVDLEALPAGVGSLKNLRKLDLSRCQVRAE